MKKRLWSSLLAVMMLLSMLAGIALPANAGEASWPRYSQKPEGYTGKEFAISTAEDWLAAVAETETGIWTGVTLHVTNDIDFKNVPMAPLYVDKNFDGTIDGHGYVFKNVAVKSSNEYGACLVHYLAGTIKDLGIESGVFESSYNGAIAGAFTSRTTSAGVLYKCWNGAEVKATSSGKYLGGLIGSAANAGTIISCYNIGTVTATSGYANSLIGYTGNKGKAYNSIGLGTITSSIAKNAAMIRAHANSFQDISRMPLYNTYAVGMASVQYSGVPSAYEKKDLTVNGHAYNSATLATVYVAESVAEAAWKVNSNLGNYTVSGYEPVYYTLDKDGNLKFGSSANKVVKITVEIDGQDPAAYYKLPGEKFRVVVGEGLYGTSDKATVDGNTITVGTEDATVTFAYNAAAELAAKKLQLQKMVGYYESREQSYFANWAAQQAWMDNAKALLQKEGLTVSEIDDAFAAEALVDKSIVEMGYPNLPSMADYAAYENTGVKEFLIDSKAAWLEAVARSDHSDPFIKPIDFAGMTLHFSANVDMGNEQMLPLCYNGILNGSVDGHGYGIDNINIEINNPLGAVGLIAMLGENQSVQNLSVDGGTIKVTGTTTYNADWKITGTGNRVGGLIGRVHKAGTLVRKCRNLADITVEGGENVGGIVGDSRFLNNMDSCINAGLINGGHGLSGYAATRTKISNSIYANTKVGVCYNFYISAATDFLFNSYAPSGKIMTYLGEEGSVPADKKAMRDQMNALCLVDSMREAAYNVNKNYVDMDLGERVWYTIDANGMIDFGSEQNQIRKITIKTPGKADEVTYAAGGSTVDLREGMGLTCFYEGDVTYLALAGTNNTHLNGSELTLGDMDVTILAGIGTYVGDANSNGKIELHDAVTVLRHLVDENVACDTTAGDVNMNTVLGADDAVLIVRGWLGDPESVFTPEKPDEGTEWIKVATYNIKGLYFDPEDPYYGQADRTEDVIAVLREADADIVGLQEVYRFNNWQPDPTVDQLKLLADELGYKYYCYTATISPNFYNGEYGHGILSRYPIVSSEHFKFADAPGNIDAAEPRAFSRHVLNVNGKELIYYNAHLATPSVPQLAYMNTYMEPDVDAGKNVMMTADYNMDPSNFKGCYDLNKFTALNGGDALLDVMPTTPLTYGSIDNIILSDNIEHYWNDIRESGVNIIRDDASDHWLLSSYIRLK